MGNERIILFNHRHHSLSLSLAMPVPVEMRVPSAIIHLPSSINKRLHLVPDVQTLFMLPCSVSERSSSSSSSKLLRLINPPTLLHCIPLETTTTEEEDAAAAGILCDEACNGKGWMICDLCQGQKTNVKANNNRLYRRCPSCKAMIHPSLEKTRHIWQIGYILCPKCKVFKCVTFPSDDDNGDGREVSF